MTGMKVIGVPRPKGSMRCIGPRVVTCNRCNHPNVVIHNVQPDDPNGNGKAWRKLLETAGHQLRRLVGGTYREALRVEAWFVMPRPAAATDRRHPTTPPDIDKLARMLLDALQESAVLTNDSLVVDLILHKRFPGDPELPAPGADGAAVLYYVAPMPDPTIDTLI